MQNNEENNPIVNEELSQEINSSVQSEELEQDTDEGTISEGDIAGLSKVQLADKLTEYLAQEEVHLIFPVAALVKKRWDEVLNEEFESKLKVFMEDGSPAEDFEPKADPFNEKIEQVWKSFCAKKTNQRKQKEKLSQDNLSTKKMIIEELKELLKGTESYSVSYNKFQALQSKWRATGNVPQQDNHTLKENYFFLTGKFYDMVKISNELNILDRKKSTEHKTQLCEKAEQLNDEPSLKKALEQLRHLQEEWTEIRNSSKELKENLWSRFKNAGDKIIEKKKAYDFQLKQQQQKNLVDKLALCEQIELLSQSELTTTKACREASEKAEAIWEAWQKISFVPKSDNGNCWKRFKKARQHFQQVMDLFYSNVRSEYASNLEKKTALCIKAETLQESTDWIGTADVLKKLQVEWKKVGPVSTKNSDAIWMRFRKACDLFFENKTKQVLEKENALKANILAKEAIISKIDLFQPSEDINQSLEELKKMQEEWSNSGEVAFNEKDRLNNAFGTSMENLLERIKSSAQVDDNLFYRLKYEQKLQSPQGMEQIKKERFVLQDKIKKLQADVAQLENNLSFFGKSKNTNPLIAEQLKNVDVMKLEIKELVTKLKFIPTV